MQGLVLLNATPFWAFLPHPERSPGPLRRLSTSLPAPPLAKSLIQTLWWNNLAAPATIRGLISLVYSHKAAADEALVERIVEATKHPYAVDAFTSIVLAPKSELDFGQMLQALRCPLVMVYGKEDPWVVSGETKQMLAGTKHRHAPAGRSWPLDPRMCCPYIQPQGLTVVPPMLLMPLSGCWRRRCRCGASG